MKLLPFITCISPQLNSKDYVCLIHDIFKRVEICNIIQTTSWEPPLEYVSEMGGKLEIELWIISNITNLYNLCELKHFLMDIENKYSVENKRMFNLNPGYLTTKGLFLLTHKPNELRKRQRLMTKIWTENQLKNISGKLMITDNTFSEFLSESRIDYFQDELNKFNDTLISSNTFASI